MHTWGLPIFCSLAASIQRLFEAPSWVLWPMLLATLVRILGMHTMAVARKGMYEPWKC